MENNNATKPVTVKQNFFEILGQLQPDLAYDLSEQVAKINQAISEFGGEGKLTLEVIFKQSSKLPETARLITCKENANMPKKSYKDSVKFSTDRGEIVSDDPAQMKLF